MQAAVLQARSTAIPLLVLNGADEPMPADTAEARRWLNLYLEGRPFEVNLVEQLPAANDQRSVLQAGRCQEGKPCLLAWWRSYGQQRPTHLFVFARVKGRQVLKTLALDLSRTQDNSAWRVLALKLHNGIRVAMLELRPPPPVETPKVAPSKPVPEASRFDVRPGLLLSLGETTLAPFWPLVPEFGLGFGVQWSRLWLGGSLQQSLPTRFSSKEGSGLVASRLVRLEAAYDLARWGRLGLGLSGSAGAEYLYLQATKKGVPEPRQAELWSCQLGLGLWASLRLLSHLELMAGGGIEANVPSSEIRLRHVTWLDRPIVGYEMGNRIRIFF